MAPHEKTRGPFGLTFGKHGGNGKDKDKDLDLDEIEQGIIEQEVRAKIREMRRQKEIARLEAELDALKQPAIIQEQRARLEASAPITQKPLPGNGKFVMRQNPQGFYYFNDKPNIVYDYAQAMIKLKELAGKEAEEIEQAEKQLRTSRFSRKPKLETVIYQHVTDETINLQAHNLMPNSDKLLFIDPKAIALPTKGVPRMRTVIEQMSRPTQKRSIDPKLLIGIAIMAVIAIIGITILYSQVLGPAADKQRAYDLEVMKHGGNATGIPKPDGGGLFKFQPPNPFAPCPTCPGGSNAKATAPLAIPSVPSIPKAAAEPEVKPLTDEQKAEAYCKTLELRPDLYGDCLNEELLKLDKIAHPEYYK